MKYVYRNTAVEYLFKDKDTKYSGYGEISSISNSDDIIIFYFLPYKYDKEYLLNFINDYLDKINFLTKKYINKNIYVTTLYNYFYKSLVLNDNDIDNCINDFNNKLYNMDNIKVIDISLFYKKYSNIELFDLKYYYLFNAIINPKYSNEFYKFIIEEINLYKNTRKKCLVVDLDNTIWKGILGEDGIENLKVSGNYPGNSFNDFQKLLLNLKRNGIILCICSKNNEKDVIECFKKRDDMILSFDDFTIKSINWNNKADQLKEIKNKLNISFDSMVFIDDNPRERELVLSLIPDIKVLNFPEDNYLLVDYFEKEFRKLFSINKLTTEDIKKEEEYKYKLMSDKLKEEITDENDFIDKLNIKINFLSFNKYNEDRFVQLINKTNQFNLTTKRYNLDDLIKMNKNNYMICGIKVIDKFGDLGITGISIVKVDKEKAIIDSFMLSCRILGRKIEYEFLKVIMNKIFDKGITLFEASYIKSNKNMQTQYFYKEFGFQIKEEQKGFINYEYRMKEKFEYDHKYNIEDCEF